MKLRELYCACIPMSGITQFRFYTMGTIYHRHDEDVCYALYNRWDDVPYLLKDDMVIVFEYDKEYDVLHVVIKSDELFV